MAKREVLKQTSELKITITAEKLIWTNEQNKAYKKLILELDIKGFRKGNVPEMIAKKHISESDIWSASIRPMLDILVKEAAKEITPEDIILDGPVYDVVKLTTTELEIAFIYPIYPEIKLGEYKNIGVKYEAMKVDNSEVEKEIENLRGRHSLLKEKPDGIIAKGNTAKFDFQGFSEGKPFEGGTAEDYELEIGSGQFIPGFEDAMIGLKVGSQKAIELIFPQEYHEASLAGKPVTFKVKVKEVKIKEVPELNDDFALEVNYPGIKTIVALRNYFSDIVQERKSQQAKLAFKDKAFAIIKKGMEFKIPMQLVSREMERVQKQFNGMLEQQGLDKINYMKMTGLTEENLMSQFKGEAQLNLEDSLVFAEIAKAEKIQLIEEDYNIEYEKLSKMYGQTIDELKKVIPMTQIQIPMTNERVIDLLVKYNS